MMTTSARRAIHNAKRAQSNGKKMKAAEILGISRKNLWEKLRLHGIANESEAEE